MNQSTEKENVLLLMITEDHLKSIIESSIKKIMLELKEDVPKIDEYLNQKETCQLLKISLSTLNNWRAAGKLKFFKIENRILIKREDIISKINELRPLHRKVI